MISKNIYLYILSVLILFIVHDSNVFAQGADTLQVDSMYLPVNLGPAVNGPYDDILPVISPDGQTLYFCRSQAPENIGGGRQDIWVSDLLPDGKWSEARNIGVPLNNRDNNYMCSITPDGNTALVADAYTDPANNQRSVAISHRTKSGWSIPQPLTIKNYYNKNRFHEFSLANDSKTLLMAIERNDSRGGKDMYVSFRQFDSSWSEPLNLGSVINTIGHEATPFIASDNSSLYFSSDGHGGYGGFDVFVTRRLDSTWTVWSEPENLGPLINTARWDIYYTIPASGDYAYYVSFSNSFGLGDIFRIKLPETARPRPVVLVKGRVLNKKTLEPIEADIAYEELPSGKELGIARSTPETGAYKIVLPAGMRYGFRASAPGFISVNENLDLTQITEYTEITRDLYLVPIEEGSVARINNIFFDYDKWNLRPESYPELDRVAQMLNANPSMIVELAGHTDSIASDKYNYKLSDQRAKSVVDYLISKHNIDKMRIKPKGYGESQPVASNGTPEGRQENRRVEMVILKK